MELQASLKAGNKSANSFEDLKQRIFALSSVHELLSESGWTPLRLEDLARELIKNTLAGSPASRRIQIDMSPAKESVRVAPGMATSIGMILAELTINSIKYAFGKGANGRIMLKIRPTGDEWGRIILTYQDSGPGFPQDVIDGSRENVGLKLIRLHTRSLIHGELAMDNQRGARVRVTFQPMPLSRVAIPGSS
jgi:two-component sensor histidine kinase